MIKQFLDFSGGLQDRTTRFLRPVNELTRAINIDASEKIGGLTKRLGYSRFGNTVAADQTITGLHGYYRLNGDAYMLAAERTNLVYGTGSAWTALSGGLTSGANYEFATFIDEVFICGYNPTTRTFDTTRNLDNLTLSTTNNLSNASDAKIPIVFRQRLYLISLSGRRSAFRYSSVPSTSGTVITWSSDDIEEVRTDDGDELIGAAELSNRLVLFKQNSMHEWNESTISQVAQRGTTSHRSIVNTGQELLFFSRSKGEKGFYSYVGGEPSLRSGKIQKWIDGISDSGFSNIVGWTQGDKVIWYVGTITKDGETFSNCGVVYNRRVNTWSIYQFADAFRSKTSFIVSGVERPYLGTTDGDVHQLAIIGDTVYTDNDDAIAALFRTTPLTLGSPEDKKQVSRSIFFAEQAQGLSFRARADGGDWQPLGQVNKTVNEFGSISAKGYYFEIEGSESSTNPPFIFEGFSLACEIDNFFE